MLIGDDPGARRPDRNEARRERQGKGAPPSTAGTFTVREGYTPSTSQGPAVIHVPVPLRDRAKRRFLPRRSVLRGRARRSGIDSPRRSHGTVVRSGFPRRPACRWSARVADVVQRRNAARSDDHRLHQSVDRLHRQAGFTDHDSSQELWLICWQDSLEPLTESLFAIKAE